MIIISDTSPISNLIQIDRLYILKELFGEINIPSFVDNEIQQLRNFNYNLKHYLQADWITIYSPIDTAFISILEKELDRGESEAIALYQQLNADLLLIDERLGTKIARKYGIETIGLIGCLIEAKKKGIIQTLKPIIKELEDIAGFYMSKKLKIRIYKIVGE